MRIPDKKLYSDEYNKEKLIALYHTVEDDRQTWIGECSKLIARKEELEKKLKHRDQRIQVKLRDYERLKKRNRASNTVLFISDHYIWILPIVAMCGAIIKYILDFLIQYYNILGPAVS